jgi:hypothetical protein
VLLFYGFLHFAKPEDALQLCSFTMLKTLPEGGLQSGAGTGAASRPIR